MSMNLKDRNNNWWGLLLVLGGLFFLVQNMGIFPGLGSLLPIMLFGAGGMFFLYWFLTDRAHNWWAAIPGCVLWGLAGTIFIDNVLPDIFDPLSGPFFLASIGLGFLLVFLSNLRNWWALIPAGVMMTIAAVAGISELNLNRFGIDEGGIFFVGLGFTFLLLGLLRPGGANTRWALIPAAIMLVMGVLIATPFISLTGYLWPLAMIVGGLALVWKNMIARQG